MKKLSILRLESLETRLNMASNVAVQLIDGLLSITGSEGDDYVTVSRSGKQLTIAQTGDKFKVKDITQIEIELGDGDDSVRVLAPGGKLKRFGFDSQIDAGVGNDLYIGPKGERLYFGGADQLLEFDRAGLVTIDGLAPDWFNQKLSDSSVRTLARSLALDGLLDRDDMLNMFALVTPGDTVGRDNFDSLKALVSNASFFVGIDYVQALSDYVVNGCVANKQYQGESLGNLRFDSSGDHLQLLVNKWFLGLDHPNPSDTVFHGPINYLEAAGNLFVGEPNYTQIHQGNDGDCYFLSGMTAITVQNPQKLVDMFIDNGDNTWTVRFFHKNITIYVTVDKTLPVKPNGEFPYADFQQRYDDPSNVLWAPLAEKAYCQYAEFGYLRTEGPKNNSYDAIMGGWPTDVFQQILGGRSSQIMNFKKGPEAIIEAFEAGSPVAFGTMESPMSSQIVSDHAYAMLGYDAQTQRFELFNPWGLHNGSQYPGIVHLTFDEIVANYADWGFGAVI